MIYKKVYDIMPNFLSDDVAIDFVHGFVWGECHTSEQEIEHANYIDTVDGVGIHYCYGTDYFFFTDESE